MAVLENMLNTESSRAVASEERINLLSNEDGGSHHVPKFKRRNVSAFRDFPPGCGRLVTGAVELATVELAALDDASEDPHVHSAPANGSLSLQDSSVPRSNAKLVRETVGTRLGDSSSLLDDSTNMPEEQIPVVIQDVLDSIKREETQKDFKVDSSKFLDLPHVDGVASLSKVVEERKSQDQELCPNNVSPQADSSLPIRTYPPPRRVSAIRDFPPLCGINMLQNGSLSMDASLTGVKMLQEPMLGHEKNKNEEEILKSVDDPAKCETKVLSMEEKCGGFVEIKGENDNACMLEGLPLALICAAPDDNGLLCVPSSIQKVETTLKRPVVLSLASTCAAPDKNGLSRVPSSIQKVETTLKRPAVLSLALTCAAPDGNGLSCVPSSSIQKGETTVKRPGTVLAARKGKKHGSSSLGRQRDASKKRLTISPNTGDQFREKIAYSMEEHDEEAATQSVPHKGDSDSESDKKVDDFIVSRRPREFSVNPIPIGRPNSTTKDDDNQCVTRRKVRETLRLFQVVCRKLLQEEESKSKEENKYKRVDLQALKILKDKKKFVNTGKHILGNVPGVEVGDEFQYRVELNVIGLHRNIQAGIDYVNNGGEILATSIVSSGAYADDVDNSDFLVYTGQGGNVVGKVKLPEDQKLERGNLALKNSITARNPVRVIRGFKEMKADSVDGRSRIVVTYIYDGLYTVDKYWQEPGQHGKMVFKFHLNRIPGQPELAWKVVKKSKKFEREGVCVHDISQGKEAIPIPAVNTIDDEKPPAFTYITRVIYPDSCRSLPPKGCDCVRKCSDSKKCACAVRNGGEIPFNHNGAIVEVKALVYECGPHCKCPPSCHNRVSQHGIKLPLEIFKTESRGWGIRCLASIPSGSFICEYVGELLDDKEADKRTGNDEYLFDIGNNYHDTSLWGELSAIMPDSHPDPSEVMDSNEFTIDAAKRGNIGRFINHSCSPNLYAQNVLYDHGDRRIPHIMFFAGENIPPLQELTYHYNYAVDEVRDANGNIRMKSCYCGTSECTGRMY